jgi:hypothetical protein
VSVFGASDLVIMTTVRRSPFVYPYRIKLPQMLVNCKAWLTACYKNPLVCNKVYQCVN